MNDEEMEKIKDRIFKVCQTLEQKGFGALEHEEHTRLDVIVAVANILAAQVRDGLSTERQIEGIEMIKNILINTFDATIDGMKKAG